MSLEEDVIWAAGLFEGEGFLVRRPVGNRVYLELGLEIRDLDVITRFVKVIRDNGIEPELRPNGPRKQSAIRKRLRSQDNPKHSDIYTWKTTGHTAEKAYLLLRPQLGERRRSKGDSVLAEAHQIVSDLPTHGICPECSIPFVYAQYGRTKVYCSTRCNARAKLRRPGERARARERNHRYELRLRDRAIHDDF